jgi:hypothetical protein
MQEVCKSFSLYFNSREDHKKKLNVSDLVDKDGKSILHYSMLMPLDKDDRVSGVALSVSLRSQSENPDRFMINSMSMFPYIANK